MSEPYGTPSAQCAIHADQRAQSICARCGNFMCNTCTEGGAHDSCPTCRDVTGAGAFPFDRNNYEISGVLGFAWGHFKREWVMLSVAMILYMVILVGVSMVSTVLQAIGNQIHPVAGYAFAVPGQVVQSLVQMVLTAGLGLVFWEVFRGRSVDVGTLFRPFSRFGTFVVAMLVQLGVALAMVTLIAVPAGIGYLIGEEEGAAVGAGIGVVLFIVPMLWVYLPLLFVPFEVVIGGETSGVQAVKNTFRLAEGNRLSILGYSIVGGLIGMVGMFACCVGVVPAVALGQMLLFGLYLALRNGSGLPPSQTL
ncbi:MAG: B-box zinc finger protein [Myxococcaceae bacterium]